MDRRTLPARMTAVHHHDDRIDTSSGDVSTSWHFVSRETLINRTILQGCDAVVSSFNNEVDSMDSKRWLRTIDDATSRDIQLMAGDSSAEASDTCKNHPPKEALEAIEATHRWASNFVRPLHLCPWAGSSLDTCGAIRYWMLLVNSDLLESTLFSRMESVIRAAGKQLEQVTSEENASCSSKLKKVDASAAISFVILVPMDGNNDPVSPHQPSLNMLPSFESFHDFFLDLEDRFLDECDEYWDQIDDSEEGETDVSDIPDGCKLTVAAFHPDWKFNNLADDSSGDVSAIDYEKRTPYPTISLVMSSAIDALMDEGADENSSSAVTNRIAASNEKTLREIGVEKLKEMFQKNVIMSFWQARTK